MTSERQKRKTVYNKKWRRENREKYRAQRKRYYDKHKTKILANQKKYYEKDKTRRLAVNDLYRKAHRVIINEQGRVGRYKKGKAPAKEYSFYRELIQQLVYLSAQDRAIIYKLILSLPLTSLQRNLVEQTAKGKSQIDMCQERNVNQSTICKMWNGSYHYKYEKFMGGIHKKFCKKIALHTDMQTYLRQLKLYWSDNEFRENRPLLKK